MTADTITLTRAEYDQLLAAPAAVLMDAENTALERAAAYAEQKTNPLRNAYLLDQKMDTANNIARAIRALATPDSTDALKRAIGKALEMAGRVKALEWKDCEATAVSEIYAETAFGLYMIDRCIGDSFLLTHCDIGIGGYTTVEAAKAAAQADYQTRGDAMRQSITADDVLRALGGRG